MNPTSRLKLSVWLMMALGCQPLLSQEVNTSIDQLAQRGLDFLRANQDERGFHSARAGSGITSLAVTAALRHGCGIDDPMVAKGLKALEGCVKPDGGIYLGGRLRN